RMARPKSVKKAVARPPTPAPQTSRRLWWAAVIGVAVAAGILAAVAFWPADPEKQQGLELAEKGRFREAEPLLQNVLERRPNDVAVLRAMVLGKFGTGRPAEAAPYLTRWCELRPREPEPFRRRMELRLQHHN